VSYNNRVIKSNCHRISNKAILLNIFTTEIGCTYYYYYYKWKD